MSARLRLKGRLDAGRAAGGLFVSIPAPEIVEIAAVAGFDFVLVDLEHTLIDGAALERMLAACDRAGVSALVRVPGAGSERILQSLDAGAAGIVVPRVASPAEAVEAVRRARHAPRGIRGLNAGRLGRYGDCDLAGLPARLDAETLVIAMIEDEAGLAAVADIAATAGLDGLLFGAADYSQAIGLPWQTGAPAVQAAGSAVTRACRAAGIHAFAIARSEADLPRLRDEGVGGLLVANDRGLLRRALSEADRAWRTLPGDLR
ncbi:HpcH/HpaI aldolase family protein [Methylobacterium platani]|uniref:Host specificity protein n=2 Tax=Methylobacterium platani TaxID=427683 RepID=A0A179S6R4_9HYPH|nr:aldolase/citrate lyase family protein [Methylobacterium platani]KMO14228.1 host specificity protein [Methylobacterium platani JCM 14648]OAS22980.1 host specificity protein [Methylobacterium platani]